MLVWALAGSAFGVGAMAWAVRGRSSRVFGPSVWHGARDRRSIALTFDDGPSEATPRVLELLARFGVRATFFLCGANVTRLPSVAYEIVAAGHEAGNHSYSHPRFDFHSPAFIHDELARAQDAIHGATGRLPELFRSPYGVRWFGLGESQRRLNLLGVMWTALALDWKLDSDGVCARLERGAAPGAIFCLHDGRVTQVRPDIRVTIDAVERLIPVLQERGFRFETVSEILCPSPSPIG